MRRACSPLRRTRGRRDVCTLVCRVDYIGVGGQWVCDCQVCVGCRQSAYCYAVGHRRGRESPRSGISDLGPPARVAGGRHITLIITYGDMRREPPHNFRKQRYSRSCTPALRSRDIRPRLARLRVPAAKRSRPRISPSPHRLLTKASEVIVSRESVARGPAEYSTLPVVVFFDFLRKASATIVLVTSSLTDCRWLASFLSPP